MANDTGGETRGTSSESRGFSGGSSSSSSSSSKGSSSSSSGGGNFSGSKASASGSSSNQGSGSGANSRGMTSAENANRSTSSSSGSSLSGASRSTAGKTSSSSGYTGSSAARGMASAENANKGSISGLSSLGDSIGKAVSALGHSIAQSLGIAGPDTTTGVGSLTGNAAAVAKEMKAAGYTDNQIAGFVGRLSAESGFDTKARAKGDAVDGTDSVGIAQWNMSRLNGPDGLNAFAKANGMDPDDVSTQAKFAVHELNTTEAAAGRALRNATSVEEAAKAAVAYERPQGYTQAKKDGDYSQVAGWAHTMDAANQISTSLRSAAPSTTSPADDPYGAQAVANAAIQKATNTAPTTGYVDPRVTTDYRTTNPTTPSTDVATAPKTKISSPVDMTSTPPADIPNPTAQAKPTSLLSTVGTVLHAAVDPVGFVVGAITGIGKPKNTDGTTDNSNDPLGVATALSTLTSGATGPVADLHGYGQNNSKTPLDPEQTAQTPVPATTNPLDDLRNQFAKKQEAAKLPMIPDTIGQSNLVYNPLDQLTPTTISMLAPFSWSKLTDTSKKA